MRRGALFSSSSDEAPLRFASAHDGTASYLTFEVSSETYAMGIESVSEIIEFPELTRVPTLPPCIRGLMNLRGTVLPVIDLSIKFGFGESPLTKRTCVIIAKTELDGVTLLLGVMTDMVRDVVTIAIAEIEAPPVFGTAVDVGYLTGMFKFHQRFALVLNTAHVLSPSEILGVRAEGGAERTPLPPARPQRGDS